MAHTIFSYVESVHTHIVPRMRAKLTEVSPMSLIEWILILFGVLPIITIFAIGLYCITLPLFGIGQIKHLGFRFQSADTWYRVPNQVIWKSIGGSIVQFVRSITKISNAATEPTFSTLHCNASQIGKAKWRLEVEFELRNVTRQEIVIDDIHACMYEKDAFQPPYA